MENRSEAPYLLTRKAAAERYSISLRQLDELYRRNRDFPVLRIGHKVLIHRDMADQYFSDRVGEVITAE